MSALMSSLRRKNEWIECIELNMAPVRQLPRAEEIGESTYKLKTLNAPVVRGVRLKVFGWLLASPIGAVVQRVIRRRSGIPQVINLFTLNL